MERTYPRCGPRTGKAQTGRSACGIVVDMSQKVPSPKDIKAAAQAAAETAQSVASGAMRIPPASIQLASQLPDLVENLATATERLNEAIDRAERYLALADPMIRTMDAILPQLEALVATGNEVYNAVASVPGVSTLSRLANRGAEAAPRKQPSKRREAAKKI
jgi:ABC-type transporter Mla subunit MlaD